MLGLKLETDPRWVNIVETNVEEILTDHAYCEQKAATNCITLIVKYPEYPDMVKELSQIAQEEMQHFEMVHDIITERGYTLGRERKDPYVNDLLKYFDRGGDVRKKLLTQRLLFSAMIEARSCERFKVLSEQFSDEKLRKFYRDLMISEANHYTTFLKYARKYGCDNVDEMWKDFLEFEGNLMKKYGKKETIHG